MGSWQPSITLPQLTSASAPTSPSRAVDLGHNMMTWMEVTIGFQVLIDLFDEMLRHEEPK